MKTSQARESILAKIRRALGAHKTPVPFPEVEAMPVQQEVFEQTTDMAPEELFATEFIKLGGKFVFCAHEQELLEHLNDLYENRGWQKLFCAEERLLQICRNNKLNFIEAVDTNDDSADACITSCEALIARTGSFMMSSRQFQGRAASIFYPVHIVIAYHDQAVNDIPDGIALITQKYPGNIPSMISLQTGPSRTADIEKTLVTGVHGPKEVFCFYVNV
jgi:L-lactate dehydrogenase complex protein LldG